MPDWTPQEQVLLQSQWRRVADVARLTGPCPWCLDEVAFRDAVVYSQVPQPGPTTREFARPAVAAPVVFPAAAWVVCECGQHDKTGCGRQGYVPVPAGLPDLAAGNP